MDPAERLCVIITDGCAEAEDGRDVAERKEAAKDGVDDNAGLELGTGVEDTDGAGDVTATTAETDEAEEDPPYPPPPPPPPLVATAVEEAHVPDGVVVIDICAPALELNE